MRKINFFATAVFLFFIVNLYAQEITSQLTIGHNLEISSKSLGEDRNIMIYLPREYFDTDEKYPVLYVLDGGGHFLHASGLVQFLSMNGLMPHTIVVAIPNTARNRDFSPTAVENLNNSGGADNFLDFMQNELIPIINSKYRTQDFKILFGHSLTGMFAIYTLSTRTDLFNAYIAVSPYLQYDEGIVIKKAKELLSKKTVNNKMLYMTIGNEPAYIEPMDELCEILEGLDSDLLWKYDKMDKDDHGSVVHKSLYAGLEFIFEGWRIPLDKTNSLISIQNHFKSISNRVGFNVIPQEFLLNQLGYQVMNKKEYDKAIDIFNENVKLYPESDNVYDSLGECYEKSGDLDLALKNYTVAVEKGTTNKSLNLKIYQTNLERVQKALSVKSQ